MAEIDETIHELLELVEAQLISLPGPVTLDVARLNLIHLRADLLSRSAAALPELLANITAGSLPGVIPTLGALRTYSGVGFSQVVVLGYHAPGDGGGGLFYSDESDTSSVDNGGTVIIVAGTTKRFKRADGGALNVRWFGAKGDGLADDQVALSAALLAGAQTKQSVYAPAGTYSHSGVLSVNGISFYGDGDGSVIQATTPTLSSILIQGTGATVSRLRKTCPSATTKNLAVGAEGIRVGAGATGFKVSECSIEGSSSAGILIHNGVGAQVASPTHGVIQNNRIINSLAAGIQIAEGANNLRIEGNRVIDCSSDMIAVDSLVGQYPVCHQLTITSNQGSTQIIGGQGIAVRGGEHIIIEANTLGPVALAGITVNAEGANTAASRQITIIGNTLRQVGSVSPERGAIDVIGDPRTRITHVAIADNQIDIARWSGIRIRESVSQLNVSQNHLSQIQRNGIEVFDRVGDLTIAGNWFNQTGLYGIHCDTNTLLGRFLITDNWFRNTNSQNGNRQTDWARVIFFPAAAAVTQCVIQNNYHTNPGNFVFLRMLEAGLDPNQIQAKNNTTTGIPTHPNIPNDQWAELQLLNNWQNVYQDQAEAAYRQHDGVVELKGLIKRSGATPANTLIGVLPPGVRPLQVRQFTTIGSNSAGTDIVGRILINPLGEIYYVSGGTSEFFNLQLQFGLEYPRVVIPATGGREFWGFNGHPLKQPGYLQISLETQLDYVAELGAGWYRVDLPRDVMTTAGHERLESLCTLAQTRNIKVLGVLLTGSYNMNRFANHNATPQLLSTIKSEAQTYAQMMTQRYAGKIDHWEMNNELDIFASIRQGDTYNPGTGIQAWQFGDANGNLPYHYEDNRYKIARAEIQGLCAGSRLGNPLTTRILNTAGWLHYGFSDRLLAETGAEAINIEAIAWHWYSEMGNITSAGSNNYDVLGHIHSYGKEVWISEINYRNVVTPSAGSGGLTFDQSMTNYLAQTAPAYFADPRVKNFFVYELFDEPWHAETNGERWYGLIKLKMGTNNQWQVDAKRPAFDALKQVIAGLSD